LEALSEMMNMGTSHCQAPSCRTVIPSNARRGYNGSNIRAPLCSDLSLRVVTRLSAGIVARIIRKSVCCIVFSILIQLTGRYLPYICSLLLCSHRLLARTAHWSSQLTTRRGHYYRLATDWSSYTAGNCSVGEHPRDGD
jgi:hypothetical protein